MFERPKPQKKVESSSSDATVGPARIVNGKMVHAKGKVNGGTQMKLSSMMGKKAAPPVGEG